MENKILRSRLGTEVHTRPEERQRLLEFGKVLGRAIEELITIVSVSTFFRWCRDEKAGKKTPNPKGLNLPTFLQGFPVSVRGSCCV